MYEKEDMLEEGRLCIQKIWLICNAVHDSLVLRELMVQRLLMRDIPVSGKATVSAMIDLKIAITQVIVGVLLHLIVRFVRVIMIDVIIVPILTVILGVLRDIVLSMAQHIVRVMFLMFPKHNL